MDQLEQKLVELLKKNLKVKVTRVDDECNGKSIYTEVFYGDTLLYSAIEPDIYCGTETY